MKNTLVSNKRVKRFINRPDVKQNLTKAIFKRLFWRVHWAVNNSSYSVPFAEDLKINLPQSGSASLIYYQGFSEPETADFVRQFLKPGMTFVDVGAHIGEYTLIAAKAVGANGSIHAFEPQSSLFPILKKNVEINKFDRVTLNQVAVSDRTGQIEFQVFNESSVSSIRKQVATDKKNNIIKVPTTSLDEYLSSHNCRADLIKIDVEGAEKLVFQGASQLLNLPKSQAPTWIFEYSPNSYHSFGYQAEELLALLEKSGYKVFTYSKSREIGEFSLELHFSDIVNLIATKDRDALMSRING
jgi:FkbM family methyltransferase